MAAKVVAEQERVEEEWASREVAMATARVSSFSSSGLWRAECMRGVARDSEEYSAHAHSYFP